MHDLQIEARAFAVGCKLHLARDPIEGDLVMHDGCRGRSFARRALPD